MSKTPAWILNAVRNLYDWANWFGIDFAFFVKNVFAAAVGIMFSAARGLLSFTSGGLLWKVKFGARLAFLV
jgi:hypothetical protein